MRQKLNIAVLTMLLVFQTVLSPLGMFGVTFASADTSSTGTITDKIMTVVELSQNDSTDKLVPLDQDGYRVNVEQEVQVMYKMELPASKKYKAGDTYILELPQAFKFTEQHTGELEVNDAKSEISTIFGEFQVNDDLQTVTFTFNSKIEGKNVTGEFYAWAAFTESVKQGELQQTIQFEDPKKTFSLDFAPVGGETTKTAVANKLMNGNEVTWTVDINKASRSIKGANLSDTITSTPDNHKLDGNIEVYKITKVLMNGNVEVEITPTKTFTSFPINLGDIKEPYRIVYKSKLNDNKTTAFTNTAKLTGTENSEAISQSDTFNIELPFYEHLVKQKNIKKDGQQITWTVLYNYDEQVIGSEKVSGVITDTLTNNTTIATGATVSTHEYVDSSIKVEKVVGSTVTTLTRGTDYTATIRGGQLIVDLADTENGSTAGYKLTYDTKADNVVANFSVNNTVEADFESVKEGSTVKQTFFYKGYTVDYEKKEIKWTITANGFDMKNAVLTDTPDSELGAPQDLSIKLTGGPNATTINDTSFETTGGNLVLDFSQSETKQWSAQDTLEVTYVTAIPEASTKTNYNNVAGIKWLTSKDEWMVAEAFSVTTQLKDDTRDNGYKRGQYNYTGTKYRTIDWEVGYNFNLDKGVTGEITDTWDANQQFVPGSNITIQPVKLNANGTWDKDGAAVTVAAPEATSTGFTFNIASALGGSWVAGKPYILNYSTKFENDVIPATANNSVSFSGKTSYLLEDKVPITYGAEFAAKEANTTSKPKHIQWSVDLNRSQTTIPSAVLTDTMDGPQQLVEDSITITQLKVSDNGVEPTNTKLVEDTDYTVAIAGKTLTITFEKTINYAYRVQYDTYIANLTGEFKNSIGVNGGTTLVGNTKDITKTAQVDTKSGAWGVGSISKDLDPFNMELTVKKTASGNNKYLTTDYKAGTPLKGAVFGLYLDGKEVLDKDGKHVTAKTSAEGIATFKGLVLENYTVKELTPPKGFMNNEEEKSVALNAETNATDFAEVVFTNDKKIYDGSFSNACGKDGTYKVEGEGKTFEIKVTDGEPSFVEPPPTITLDADLKPQFATGGTAASITVGKYGDKNDGKIRIQNLPVGTYTITQTEVPLGYIAGKTTTLTIADDKTTIQTSEIPCEKINVTITNVEGDPVDDTPGTNNDPKISGSTFKVYKATDNSCPGVGTTITPGTGYTDVTEDLWGSKVLTTVDGKITIDFTKVKEPGKYVIVQDHVVSQYHVDRPHTVVSCVDITTTTTTHPDKTPIFENERIPSSGATVEIVKTNKADKNTPIKNVVFELKGTLNGNSKPYYGKTDADGKITTWYASKADAESDTGTPTPLVNDNYDLTEVAYPTGYENLQLEGTINGVSINSDRKIKFTFLQSNVSIPVTNEKIDRPIKITNSCGLEQSTYQIEKTDGTVIKTLSPNAKIKLTKKDSTKVTLTVSEGVTHEGVTVFDASTGIITLPEGFTSVEIQNVELDAGRYTVKQLTASGGCVLQDTNQGADIKPDTNPDKTIEYKIDVPIITTVTNKEPDGGKPIPGSTFKVYKLNVGGSCPPVGEEIVTNSYTDVTYLLLNKTVADTTSVLATADNGQFTIDWSKLGSGQFVIVQDDVNKYYVNKQNVPVQIDSSYCYTNGNTPPTTPPTFENVRKTGELTLIKTDEQQPGKPVKGAKIQIEGKNSGEKYTGTTNSDGRITQWTKIGTTTEASTVVQDLYIIKETESPKGYDGTSLRPKANQTSTVLNGNEVQFELIGTQGSTTGEILVENKRLLTTLTIKNSCGKGESTYEIHVKNGNSYEKVIADAAGNSLAPIIIPANTGTTELNEITVTLHLPPGDYKVVQITGSEGECVVQDNPPADPTKPDFTVPTDGTDPKPKIDETDVGKCTQDFVIQTTIAYGTVVVIDGKEYTVGENGELTLPKSGDLTSKDTYEVVSKAGHFVGVITIDDCTGTFKQEVPVCAKEILITLTNVDVKAGDKVNVNGVEYTVSATNTITIPAKTLNSGTYEVMQGGKAIGTITIEEDCVGSFVETAPTCPADVVVTTTLTPGTEVTIDGKSYTVDPDGKVKLPMGDFEPGKERTVDVVDKTGEKVGTITVDDCQGTFTPVPVPPAPTCPADVVVTTTLTPGTEVTIDGNPYTVDPDGKVTLPMGDFEPGKETTADVFDKTGEKVGTITVDDCQGTFTPVPAPSAPTCPADVVVTTTLTPGTEVTIGGNPYTVDPDGKVTLPMGDFEPGKETTVDVVDKTGEKVGTITVDDCQGTFTPDPGTPNPGTPDPGTPEPGTTEPGTPEPGTSEPVKPDPGTPDPGTTEPVKPDPGTPNPGTTTQGGKKPPVNVVPTTQLPPTVVQEIASLKDLILGYPSELPTAEELDRLLGLYNDYLKMTPAQKREFEKLVDINALRDLLLAEGVKLPQTNGDLNTTATMLGLALLAMAAVLLVRRRKTAK